MNAKFLSFIPRMGSVTSSQELRELRSEVSLAQTVAELRSNKPGAVIVPTRFLSVSRRCRRPFVVGSCGTSVPLLFFPKSLSPNDLEPAGLAGVP